MTRKLANIMGVEIVTIMQAEVIYQGAGKNKQQPKMYTENMPANDFTNMCPYHVSIMEHYVHKTPR